MSYYNNEFFTKYELECITNNDNAKFILLCQNNNIDEACILYDANIKNKKNNIDIHFNDVNCFYV